MKPSFTILVVHGDGSRVARFALPRWLVYGTLGAVAVTCAASASLSAHLVIQERQARRAGALQARVNDQQALIEAVRKRVAVVRDEIATWKERHARMWTALGPDAPVDESATGVGGGTSSLDELPAPPVHPLIELDRLASSLTEEGPRLRELEDVVGRLGKLLNTLPLRWPVSGRVNSEFGKRRSPFSGRLEQHRGLDIGAPQGTPVKAPAAATVVVASTRGGYGKHVKLDHGNGVRSLFGHLSAVDVKVGQRLEKGQVIGKVGSTGRSTGPHLHYEIRVDGERVDPRKFLFD
jgi:murein DD-endopeptidase MepM/ murein hydrolase activator NlpD